MVRYVAVSLVLIFYIFLSFYGAVYGDPQSSMAVKLCGGTVNTVCGQLTPAQTEAIYKYYGGEAGLQNAVRSGVLQNMQVYSLGEGAQRVTFYLDIKNPMPQPSNPTPANAPDKPSTPAVPVATNPNPANNSSTPVVPVATNPNPANNSSTPAVPVVPAPAPRVGFMLCKVGNGNSCEPLAQASADRIYAYYGNGDVNKGREQLERMSKDGSLAVGVNYSLQVDNQTAIAFKVAGADKPSQETSPDRQANTEETIDFSQGQNKLNLTESGGDGQKVAERLVSKIMTSTMRLPQNPEVNRVVQVMRANYENSLVKSGVLPNLAKDLADKRYNDLRLADLFNFGNSFQADTRLSSLLRGNETMGQFANGSLMDLTLRQVASVAGEIVPKCEVHNALAYLTYEGEYINVYKKMERRRQVSDPFPRTIVETYYDIDCNKSWFDIYDQSPVSLVNVPFSAMKDRTDIGTKTKAIGSTDQTVSESMNKLSQVSVADTGIAENITPATGITCQVDETSTRSILEANENVTELNSTTDMIRKGVAFSFNPSLSPMRIDITVGTDKILVEQKVEEQLNPFSLNSSNPQGQNKQEKCVLSSGGGGQKNSGGAQSSSCANTQVNFLTLPKQVFVLFQDVQVNDSFGTVAKAVSSPKPTGMAFARVGDHVIRVHPVNCAEAPVEKCDYAISLRFVFKVFPNEMNGTSFLLGPFIAEPGIQQGTVIMGALPIEF